MLENYGRFTMTATYPTLKTATTIFTAPMKKPILKSSIEFLTSPKTVVKGTSPNSQKTMVVADYDTGLSQSNSPTPLYRWHRQIYSRTE